MVLFEVLSGKVPFEELPAAAVGAGAQPPRNSKHARGNTVESMRETRLGKLAFGAPKMAEGQRC